MTQTTTSTPQLGPTRHRTVFAATSGVAIAAADGREGLTLWRALLTVCVLLFAHHAVPVRVAHVPISGVATSDRRNPVRTGLRAGDAAVPVIVPQG